MRNFILIFTNSLFVILVCTHCRQDTSIPPENTIPSIFSEPVLRTTHNGIPINTYGYTDILGESPDLLDTIMMQVGNNNPMVKVHPKNSSEIKFNRLGTTSPRMPRSISNDYLPLEPINLIDGDHNTCWSSKSVSQAMAEPAWIRIDLPVERKVKSIILQTRKQGPERNQAGSCPIDKNAVEVGRAIPNHIQIKISCDGQNWINVYNNEIIDTSLSQLICDFNPLSAKQILIIGNNLPRVENWLHSFSISEVEILDTNGNNQALVFRGSGVTVSSTQHSMGQTRDEHRWLWPIHVDLGLKWVRVGYHDDPINWHWVEKEKGKLEIDAEADAAITYLVERGIGIDFVLGFGNRLYTQSDPSRKLPQLWEWYYENPKPPTTREALDAWERYVRFMVRHFRDRIKIFEIWNEWNIPTYWGDKPDTEHYIEVVKRTIPIIREESPEAKIKLGAVSGFTYGISNWTPEELAKQENEMPFLKVVGEFAEEVDIIGWHPFYQTDTESDRFRSYSDDVKSLKKWASKKGFDGEFFASEWNYGANYPPPTPPNWWGNFEATEMDKAKYIARLSVLHTALGVNSFFCETWSNYYPLDLSLLRRSFSGSPVSVLQPQAAYYVTRNLATALEDLQPADFDYSIDNKPSEIESCEMSRKGERVIGLWIPGHAKDNFKPLSINLEIPGNYKAVVGYSCLNGVNQEILFENGDNKIRINNLLVYDYPILIRLVEK
ncbi:discoidin domain-containing protein [Bacteroidota bacterium]